MFEFCPHCGSTMGGREQVVGKMVTCAACGKDIGVVSAPPQKVVVDQADELIRGGTAARCPACGQLVELKGAARTFVPHFQAGAPRRMCRGSGKPAAAPLAPPPAAPVPQGAPPPAVERKPAGKDLSAYMHREEVRLAACRRGAEPTIEALRLEYLDRADRVRLQIDALRDILGKSFRMLPYPPELNRPHLAVWIGGDACVVGKKHEHGGCQPMAEDELARVIEELRSHRHLFLA